MARDVIGSTIRFRRNTSDGWAAVDTVLGPGEPGYERDTGKLKVGDGHTKWNDLDYFIADEYITALIHQILSDEGVDGDVLALIDHINSATPHPVYDDGPSLLLLYENAKV